MDPLAFLAVIAAVAGAGIGWCLRCRARRAEHEVERLRAQLAAERYAACHDPLTGLLNRRSFYEQGERLLADESRCPLAAVVFDLNDFKQINDVFGHAAGDQVLVTVARRFARFAGSAGGDLVARLGGDEFAGLFTVPALDALTLGITAQHLNETLSAPLRVGGCVVTVTVSVGLVPVEPTNHLADAVHQADVAMYRTKHNRMRMRPALHAVYPAKDGRHTPLRLERAG